MKHASVGDPLRIPATTWNQLLGTVEKTRQPGGEIDRGGRQDTTCIIRNDTGADLPEYGIVGFAAPLVTPSDNLSDFKGQIAFSAIVATSGQYDLKWGVALGPIAKGAWGKAVVQGLTFAEINLPSTGPIQSAYPNPAGDVNYLLPTSCGLARVIWNPLTVTGPQWCVICLG